MFVLLCEPNRLWLYVLFIWLFEFFVVDLFSNFFLTSYYSVSKIISALLVELFSVVKYTR